MLVAGSWMPSGIRVMDANVIYVMEGSGIRIMEAGSNRGMKEGGIMVMGGIITMGAFPFPVCLIDISLSPYDLRCWSDAKHRYSNTTGINLPVLELNMCVKKQPATFLNLAISILSLELCCCLTYLLTGRVDTHTVKPVFSGHLKKDKTKVLKTNGN